MEIVVLMASCLSTSPSTDSLTASDVALRRSLPSLPVAAISAAREIVSETATPILEAISCARPSVSFLIEARSPGSTIPFEASPYTLTSLVSCLSASINTLAAVAPNIVRGTVSPTVNWRPAH